MPEYERVHCRAVHGALCLRFGPGFEDADCLYIGGKRQGEGGVGEEEKRDESRDEEGCASSGMSFQYQLPVTKVIGDRLAITFLIAVFSLILIYLIAIPVGIFAAIKQYSVGDFIASSLCYIGLAIPNFMLALFLMYFGLTTFGMSVGGLFSPEYLDAPWSWAKFGDLLGHLWVPTIVLAVTGTAFQIRTIRATLLDELNKLYVKVARSKGLSERQVLWRYPIRIAMR